MKDVFKDYEYYKVLSNEGEKRSCEICQKECLAISYCEHCVKHFLELNFSKWSSGDDNIDNLIQKCQMGVISPKKVIEWIPYNEFENIQYFAKGG